MRNLENSVQLLGNLGGDAEVKSFESGKGVVNFSIATTEKWTDSVGKKIEDTQWHSCVMYRNEFAAADKVAKYLTKGTRIILEGKLKNRSYEDKDNIKRYVTEVIVNEFKFISTKAKTNNDSEIESEGGTTVEP